MSVRVEGKVASVALDARAYREPLLKAAVEAAGPQATLTPQEGGWLITVRTPKADPRAALMALLRDALDREVRADAVAKGRKAATLIVGRALASLKAPPQHKARWQAVTDLLEGEAKRLMEQP